MEQSKELTLSRLAASVAKGRGLELVDTEIKKQGGRDVVVVYINKESGIGVDDCAGVSRELDVLLEAEGIMKNAYTLEVSSPGLTRLLKSQKDFEQKVGEEIRIKFFNEHNTAITVTGKLASVNENEINLIIPKEGPRAISLSSIKSAKQEIKV